MNISFIRRLNVTSAPNYFNLWQPYFVELGSVAIFYSKICEKLAHFENRLIPLGEWSPEHYKCNEKWAGSFLMICRITLFPKNSYSITFYDTQSMWRKDIFIEIVPSKECYILSARYLGKDSPTMNFSFSVLHEKSWIFFWRTWDVKQQDSNDSGTSNVVIEGLVINSNGHI